MSDNVNHPVHYTQGSIECIDALKAAIVGKKGIEAVCVANVIKYLWRYEEKNGIEDVYKAQWYLNCLIKEIEEEKNKAENNNTTYTEKYCCYCCFREKMPNEEPCNSCKNNYDPSSEQYKTFPLKFQPHS